MGKGNVIVYYGEGRGKTSSAIGYAMQAASQGKSVIIIQFLKGKSEREIQLVRRLEPEIKFFRFEKSQANFNELSAEEKKEECQNIRNGFNFARKVLVTGECNILILDELLGLLDNNVISQQELASIFHAKSDETEIVFTGRTMPSHLENYADEIYKIQAKKTDVDNRKR
jgi:cob(I)alamin adenosyltransferase